MECVVCKSTETLKTCGGCSKAKYCSVACQEKDWNDGNHEEICSMISHFGHKEKEVKQKEATKDLPLLFIAVGTDNWIMVRALLRVRKKYFNTVHGKLINDIIDLNGRDEHGNTPLMMASFSTDGFKIPELLIVAGANVNDVNRRGIPTLTIFSAEGKLDVVRLLLENGADVNIRDKSGRTALMSASFQGKLDVVRLLLEKYANVNLKTDDGGTALMFARHSGHLEVAKALIAAGAKER